jgi:hypothetical protein
MKNHWWILALAAAGVAVWYFWPKLAPGDRRATSTDPATTIYGLESTFSKFGA